MKKYYSDSENEKNIFSRMHDDNCNRIIDLISARDKQETEYRKTHPAYDNKIIDRSFMGAGVAFMISAFSCDSINKVIQKIAPNSGQELSQHFGLNLQEIVGVASIVACVACVLTVAYRELMQNSNDINRSLAQKTDTEIYRITKKYSDNGHGIHKYPHTPHYYVLQQLQDKHYKSMTFE